MYVKISEKSLWALQDLAFILQNLENIITIMFKKIREYKDAYQQGRLDSLADNAYLMAIVLVSLIYDIKVETDTQLEKFYQDIVSVLHDFNPDFRELQIPSSDIEDVYNSYTQQLLDDALGSYRDVYTPGGESYKVLKDEYTLSAQQILNMGNEYRMQITSNLEKLQSMNMDTISNIHLQKHTDSILSKL
jgi:hypothetical protein